VAGDRHAELPRLWTRLYGYALSLVSDDERARDLVQETAVRAMGARAVPDEPAAYRAWLFRILRNALTDELRRHRRRSEPEPGPVDVWRFDEARIARITVQQGLAALPVHHREIIALIDIVGFSYAEAAALLDIPQGTVMSRISRARQALLGVIESSSVHPLKRHHGN
jgi:RNA polymerase sigma-70 factor, ECF subfamily